MSKILQSYLRFFAKIYLKRAKPKIVAVTGSVGKTSTKEAIFEVLKIKFGKNVRKSEGNLNNETGVPLAILGYKKSPEKFWQWLGIILTAKLRALFGKKYQILVLEMAADKPGDIKYLVSFARPDIAVLTSIGPAHLEAFGSIEKIVLEKTSLLQALKAPGFAVLNLDDEKIKAISGNGQWQQKTYALQSEADVEARNITTEIEDFRALTNFQVVINSKTKFRVSTPTLGRSANVSSALAAVAVAEILGLDQEAMVKGLANFRTGKRRMEVVEGRNKSIILDDSYNANPLSMRTALDTLKTLPRPPANARKIAVLGDMLEIGKISEEAHRLIGEYAREIADEVFSVGDLAKGYQAKKHFNHSEEAGEYLLSKILPGDIILIKASRAIGLEKIVDLLRVSE
ncbi:MAG TPA: UDP-N-acetylmuramoyl-tripeptide--D-alanyl-D-alanine ligase [Patescibacteria group bacterium]|nr:UDP-N-acetylmuramoyl-tripeptide--D-alanyl-D-alanine ligase [Patescibacteria group bacterium]